MKHIMTEWTKMSLKLKANIDIENRNAHSITQ